MGDGPYVLAGFTLSFMPPTTDRIRAIHAAVILFLAALLMFWAEPLAARMVLPFLGGSPMVWTTAMVFFQVALLAALARSEAALGPIAFDPRWTPLAANGGLASRGTRTTANARPWSDGFSNLARAIRW